MRAPDGLAPTSSRRRTSWSPGWSVAPRIVLVRPPDRRAGAGREPTASGLRARRAGAVLVATPDTAAEAVRSLMEDRNRRIASQPRARHAQSTATARSSRRHARAVGVTNALRAMSRGRSSLCVVQARTGSTRFPGKVLQEFGGRPLLRFMLDRLEDLRVDEFVVATSTLGRDDAVVEIACRGRPVVRGSEPDVLDRFAGALDAHPADHVVRLTADCPLADPVLSSRCSPATSIGPPTTPRTCSREPFRAVSTAR